MAKVNKNYTLSQIERSLKDNIKQISENVYLVNNKNTVINNKKSLRCDCKWASDNKLHIKYCHCCLAVLHKIDRDEFWKEIKSKYDLGVIDIK